MSFWRIPARMRCQAQVSHSAHTRLSARWLGPARGAWIVVILFLLGVFLAGLPESFALLHRPCLVGDVACNGIGALTPSQIQGLPGHGLSLDTYVWSVISISGVGGLFLFVLAGILFWRRSDDWMVLLVALLFGSFGTSGVTNLLAFDSPLWSALSNSVLLIVSLAILLTLALFPNGWFVPPWGWWFALVYPTYVVFYFVFLNPSHLSGWILFNNPVNAVGWFGSWLILTLAQLYRYVRVSTPAERQQTRWVAFSFCMVLVIGIVGLAIGPTLLSILHNGFLYLLITFSYSFADLLIPLSIGIAITRYRLYEIDPIINRTLVYGLLTAILLAVYLLLVFGGQFLLANFFGPNNGVVLVVSTLLVAALFQPLRQRIQVLIDRRFYRQKYDAARTLAAFSALLRTEMDVGHLSEQVVRVVQETMHPTFVSLWLVKPQKQALAPSDSPRETDRS